MFWSWVICNGYQKLINTANRNGGCICIGMTYNEQEYYWILRSSRHKSESRNEWYAQKPCRSPFDKFFRFNSWIAYDLQQKKITNDDFQQRQYCRWKCLLIKDFPSRFSFFNMLCQADFICWFYATKFANRKNSRDYFACPVIQT